MCKKNKTEKCTLYNSVPFFFFKFAKFPTMINGKLDLLRHENQNVPSVKRGLCVLDNMTFQAMILNKAGDVIVVILRISDSVASCC